jgi:hypothetical protein
MALRGDLLTLKVQQHSSATADEIIAESTSVSIDFSAEALETTSKSSALNATFQGGKVTGTVSGDYLLASDGDQFTNLFTHMNAGDEIDIDVQISASSYFTGAMILTSLSLGGGLSDSLATGSYAGNITGAISFT